MKNRVLKIVAVFIALAFIAYVGLSLALDTWNPAHWTDTKQTQADTSGSTGDGNTNDKPNEGKPTTPTEPDKPNEEKPTEPDEEDPNTVAIKAFTDEVNSVLRAIDNINYDGELFVGIAFRHSELSEVDKETKEVQAATEAYTLVQEQVIYDGYWWAPLEVRQQAANILIKAGLRTEGDIPPEEIPYHSKPNDPLTTEAQKFIDAVNDALDTKDIRQYHLLNMKSYSDKLSASDRERKEVGAALTAAEIIVNNSRYISGLNYSLNDDARLEAASIMIAAGLRENISWVK